MHFTRTNNCKHPTCFKTSHQLVQNSTASLAINAPPMVVEGLWHKHTGFKVDGPVGWLWTAAWLLRGTAAPMLDAWARHGYLGGIIPEPLCLSVFILGAPHEGVL
jgi:hypothetical protein